MIDSTINIVIVSIIITICLLLLIYFDFSAFLTVFKVLHTLLTTAYIYTVNHKKRDILFLTITLANLN